LYFTRISNRYINSSLPDVYGVSRKFLVAYIIIDKYRSYEDISWFTINEILKHCGCKTSKNKTNAYIEIINVLNYLLDKRFIKINTDLNNINGNYGIKININPDFDATDKFTTINSNEFNIITSSKSSASIENLIAVFLYIKSYIFKRILNEDGTEKEGAKERPESFFREVDLICLDTGLSKQTIDKCLNELVSLKLLVKHEVGSCIKIKKGKKLIENVPNIYVLNNNNANQEIEWTLNKMKDFYHVDKFNKATSKNIIIEESL
jgi:hypothetical protein